MQDSINGSKDLRRGNMDTEFIATAIKSNFPQAIIDSNTFRNELTLTIKKEFIVQVARFLKEDKELHFNFLSDLCGVDRVEADGIFEVVYHLYSIDKNHRVRLKVPIPSNELSIPTVTDIWRTANWHERETYDMFGITFTGHPDLRKILTPEDFEGYPLRKDYPIDGRQPPALYGTYRKGKE
ncbi:MAG: NADH-ubiquinone oxidoreductase chain C [Candidatus Jettenia ecosi]|uniref:NADH-quinone oxidoreductase subunit C n=1 Tax=Candidatus Jettenia ecosi TaxID=2494326 RepID=A0A533QD98_9BACT|nr:MAG: NADH-ubiquinone oxidoreductase chain C [Candidatus Jettenia ecosi]